MRHSLEILAVLTAIGLLLPAGAHASDYYVAQNDAKVSDDNDGSAGTPWKTIARGPKTLKPGDTPTTGATAAGGEEKTAATKPAISEAVGSMLGKPKRPPEPQPTVAPREKPAEFFVANQSTEASDQNPGTSEKPFKTIARGVKELKPGDTLTVRDGTYRENVKLEIVADAQHQVTVCAATGATVVIKGSIVAKGWVKDGRKWKLSGWTAQRVRELGGTTANPSWVIQKDGIRDEAVVLYRVRNVEEMREGKFILDEKTGELTAWPVQADGGEFDPNAKGMEIPAGAGSLWLEGRYTTVRGFQVRHTSMTARGWHCTMEDCIATWSEFLGNYISGFYTVVRRCETSYCGNSGMGGGNCEEVLIEDCVSTHNNLWRYWPAWHCGGAKLIPYFNKSVIRGCRFAYNYGPGLWLDGCDDNIIENCVAYENEGPGIMVEISPGCLVRNNISRGNRVTMPGVDLEPKASTGRDTSPMRCDQHRVEGGGSGAGILISSSPFTRVFNNLCVENAGGGIHVDGPKRDRPQPLDYLNYDLKKDTWVSSHNVDVRNNILIYNRSCQLDLARNGRDEDTYKNHSDYNLMVSPMGVPVVRWGFGGGSFDRMDKWRKESGFDTHSIEGLPAFESSATLDFRLVPDSQGVDQGQLLADVPVDMRGAKRPLGQRADIGPFEIAGSRRILEKPAIPEGLTYFQVDLKPFINRTFADDKADDGKGGWTDQGPAADLRSFPTGKQMFEGVPFEVSPKGCIVLKCLAWRPQSKDLPEKVVIPIKRKADVLVFLHTAAYLGHGHAWSYIIHRADGTKEEIKAVGGDNIRDWSETNANAPFPREYPTTSRMAWSGSNKTFDKVHVCMMTWVNTATWCDITDVEMVAVGANVPAAEAMSRGVAVPVLIGITGGIKK